MILLQFMMTQIGCSDVDYTDGQFEISEIKVSPNSTMSLVT